MKVSRLTRTFTRLLSCITLGLGIGVAAIAVSYDSYWNRIIRQSSRYDQLLDPPPVRSEWKYEEPNSLEPIPTGKANEGEVIGRVYYVRNVPPSFRTDLSKFLSDPFNESEQFALYRLSMVAGVGVGLSLWILIEFYYYRKRVKYREAETLESTIEEQNQIWMNQYEERIKELEEISKNREQEIQYIKSVAPSPLSSQKIEADASVEKLSQEIKDLRSQLHLAKQENMKSQSRFAAIEQERIQMEQALVEAKKRVKEQELNDNTQQRVLEEARRERDKLQERIHKLEIERAQLPAENTTIDKLEWQLRITEEKHNSEIKKQKENNEELQRILKDREDEMKRMKESIELLNEEMGKHPLNSFEQKLKDTLIETFGEASVLVQFDVAMRGKRSRIADFIVGMSNCVVIIEAKNYSGRIIASNPRNGFWFLQKGSENIQINASWGKNPYSQVKTYCDSLMDKSKSLFRRSKKLLPIYGLVVFPSDSEIHPELINEFNSKSGGQDTSYVMIASLKDMIEQLKIINTSSNTRNDSNISGEQLIEKLRSNQ